MPRRLRVGEKKTCKCGAKIIGAETVKGKTAPVEVAANEKGNVWLGRGVDGQVRCATLAGPLLEKAREVGMALHLNHFASCPHAREFSRG